MCKWVGPVDAAGGTIHSAISQDSKFLNPAGAHQVVYCLDGRGSRSPRGRKLGIFLAVLEVHPDSAYSRGGHTATAGGCHRLSIDYSVLAKDFSFVALLAHNSTGRLDFPILFSFCFFISRNGHKL